MFQTKTWYLFYRKQTAACQQTYSRSQKQNAHTYTHSIHIMYNNHIEFYFSFHSILCVCALCVWVLCVCVCVCYCAVSMSVCLQVYNVYTSTYTIYELNSFRFLDFIIIIIPSIGCMKSASDSYSFAVCIVCFYCSFTLPSFIIYLY